MAACRLCGIKGYEVRGVVLQRINETGVDGVWECRPICGAQLTNEEALTAATNGTFENSRYDNSEQGNLRRNFVGERSEDGIY
jgi:hypothetical protein